MTAHRTGAKPAHADGGDHGLLADRARAVERLVRSKASPGCAMLGVVAAVMDSATWLKEGDVAVVDALAAKLPVAWSVDDSVAVIGLPDGEGALYLALEGRFNAGEIARALIGSAPHARVASCMVRDAAWNSGG